METGEDNGLGEGWEKCIYFIGLHIPNQNLFAIFPQKQKPPDGPAKSITSVSESTKPRSTEKISITKVYDFAGEEVR